MTAGEFHELQRRAAAPIASDRELDEWVDAVLAGEPHEGDEP